jgi:hypothetical protein
MMMRKAAMIKLLGGVRSGWILYQTPLAGDRKLL